MPAPKPLLSPEDVFCRFVEETRAVDGRHVARLFCRQEKPDQVVCIMDVSHDDPCRTDHPAHQLVQGTLTHIYQIHPDFRCLSRSEGQLNDKSCYCCRAHLNQGDCTIEVDHAFKSMS